MAMPNPQCEQFSLVLSQLLENQRQEEDELIVVFNEQLRKALQESRRRNTFALLTVENASEVIKQKDNELVIANLKTQELHENLQKAIEERDFWRRIAMENMGMAANLQINLENMGTPSPCFSSTVRSMTQSVQVEVGESSHTVPSMPCKYCHLKARMVFLPCRHLSVCQLCAFTMNKCPICNADKLQVIEALYGDEEELLNTD